MEPEDWRDYPPKKRRRIYLKRTFTRDRQQEEAPPKTDFFRNLKIEANVPGSNQEPIRRITTNEPGLNFNPKLIACLRQVDAASCGQNDEPCCSKSIHRGRAHTREPPTSPLRSRKRYLRNDDLPSSSGVGTIPRPKKVPKEICLPPQNFRDISIFPKIDDIRGNQDLQLRPNKVGAKYMSCDDYLDLQFRLLREDFIRPLRDGIWAKNYEEVKKNYDIKNYGLVQIDSSNLRNIGLKKFVKFHAGRKMNWQKSKRLQVGNIVCLSKDNFQDDLVFGTICQRENRDLHQGRVFVDFSKSGIRDSYTLVGEFRMIEYSNLFEAYRPVLEALQSMDKVPYQRFIVKAETEILSPSYLMTEKPTTISLSGKTFDTLDFAQWPSHGQLGIDESQMLALQNALTNELSIIQGPPGTGKTHVGLMIAEAFIKNRLQDMELDEIGTSMKTSLLVVCYTNHALDQFLEGISKFTDSIVRIGGEKSISESMQKYSIRNLKPPAIGKTYARLKSAETRLNELIYEIQNPYKVDNGVIPSFFHCMNNSENCEASNESLETRFLLWLGLGRNAHELHADGELWIKKVNKQHQISKARQIGKHHAQHLEKNISRISVEEAHQLYKFWADEKSLDNERELTKCKQNLEDLRNAFESVKKSAHFQYLTSVDVIGMTTTCAAKNRSLLQSLPIRVMIIEEAAEVLEAHIVTSLPPKLDHLVLIGDHQQLKPSPTVFQLAKKFHLDMSLFERLIRNGCKHIRLQVQHRMQRRIADLLRLDIYQNLEDAPQLLNPVFINGMKSNIFFVSHNHEEEAVSDDASKANSHEASFVVGLCNYLLHSQNYQASQITVLTTYKGQMYKLFKERDQAESSFKDVRITCVDNFQGEENDIIILSLVRSNHQGKVGFLDVDNRICVALSRAKKALYAIGNFDLLKRKSHVWANIIENLEQDELIGTSLPVICHKHQVTKHISTGEEFLKLPKGNCCSNDCDVRLECGHTCPHPCHNDDIDHDKIKCEKPCEAMCEAGIHRCEKICYQPCDEKCMKIVEKTMTSCGHLQKMPCHLNPEDHSCQIGVVKIHPLCQHSISLKCGSNTFPQCRHAVPVLLSCLHTIDTDCCIAKSPLTIKCTEPCKTTLSCGHLCKGNCGTCHRGRLHLKCKEECTRVLVCGHKCNTPCPQNCLPCEKKCAIFCEHNKCNKPCWESCSPCKEKCKWRCSHFKCTKLCSEPCNRPPCNRPCKKLLEKCKHPCIGLCGEPCPKLCRICDKEEVTNIFFGDEDEEDARFVQLEDCGHIFTYTGLDTWMQQDENGDASIKLKECPQCKSPIRKSRRYGNVVNKQLRMMEEVKDKVNGKKKDLQKECSELHAKLKPQELSKAKLEVIRIRMQMATDIKRLKSNTYYNQGEDGRLIDKDVTKLLEWCKIKRKFFSTQEIQDYNCEIRRIEAALQYCDIKHKFENSGQTLSSDVDELFKEYYKTVFETFTPFHEGQKLKIDKIQKELKEKIPNVAGLGITEHERRSILKAMNFGNKGHWYKCKNGHVYCITQCGGAMQRSNCPECNEVIGGQSHRLEEGNAVASVMDGGTRPAYDPNNQYIPPEAFM